MGEQTPKIELVLGNSGRAFRRWTDVGIQLRLDALAHSFTFKYVDAAPRLGPAGQEIADSINEGDRVRVKVNGATVIDGYVDVVTIDVGLELGSLVSVQGRSATADLVDCSAQHYIDPPAPDFAAARAVLTALFPAGATRKAVRAMAYNLAAEKAEQLKSGEWRQASFAEIVPEICEPFGVDAVAGDGGTDASADKLAEIERRAAVPFRRAAINPGEHAADFLLRLATERGLTLTATVDGDLAYTIAGVQKIPGALEEGRNIGDGGKRVGDFRDRFSVYRILGQSAGDKDWFGDNAQGGASVVSDTGVVRHRPYIATAESSASGGEGYEAVAIWERNRRAARSRRATAPVLSWLDPAGNVWLPNRLIDVRWPSMRIEGELLIEAVDLSFDLEDGDTGSLQLVHPGAYDPLKVPGNTSKNKGNKTVAKFVKKLAKNWIQNWTGGES